MDKRYQVFVSSTFTDLQDERKSVIQTLMEMDCIPAGMELFPAIDEEQWEFIKRIIDDCDYYLLIIGGRYGSMAEDGLSYTEKEFDYAVSKGMRVVVLIHENPSELPIAKSDINPEIREKLSRFIEKASSGRLRKTWSTVQDLPGLVALSMTRTIKAYPAVGWVRADKISNESALSELNELRKTNEELQKKIALYENPIDFIEPENLAGLEYNFNLSYQTFEYDAIYERNVTNNRTILISLERIFFLISPFIIEEARENTIIDILKTEIDKSSNSVFEYIYLDTQDIKTIYLNFKALNLISHNTPLWKLTPRGVKLMMELRSIKKQ
ncbi:hypothetical protein CYR55_14040 [Chimaeribacter californicus]|uniref:DUF4062 domain-containing protein n=1 Tax=Chimaeribacter californicus TaxID=2060067 RepID=A0A2N5E2V0_9GAMM|nr:DUF4062 domain-containing protein [Chimaeribacter californicus]PLR35022.1 hypothetical protein CYR55_14040 [Chimaeribacter californicus]